MTIRRFLKRFSTASIDTAAHRSRLSADEAYWLQISIVVASAFIYLVSNPKPARHYDYTLRIAESFLRGRIGLISPPPPWLNEFVPLDDVYYSVFPLGSVLTMLPFALLKLTGFVAEMPSGFIAAALAGTMCWFLLRISQAYCLAAERRLLTVLAILFGTWTWTNLSFGGAWQLALGFAMVGELGAIYFTEYNPRPFVASIFFALAFGNRTEVLITAPIFLYFLMRNGGQGPFSQTRGVPSCKLFHPIDPSFLRRAAAFCIAPFSLGVATLFYNYARFRSFADFGYARIPGVLGEPWYSHGIFSPYYIPRQAWEMLLKPWETHWSFPYVVPDAFSSSILCSSPFLLFAFRSGARDRLIKNASWLAVLSLCLILWMHGNSGGWQFGYRYAMVCLPWLFIILLESVPNKVSIHESVAYIFSFITNAYAVWLFHWTSYIRP